MATKYCDLSSSYIMTADIFSAAKRDFRACAMNQKGRKLNAFGARTVGQRVKM
jgi:hypothetical protein